MLFRCSIINIVEYYDIDPAQEREIFQRVQLGMTLTAAGVSDQCFGVPCLAHITSQRSCKPFRHLLRSKVLAVALFCVLIKSKGGYPSSNLGMWQWRMVSLMSLNGIPSAAVTIRTLRISSFVVTGYLRRIYRHLTNSKYGCHGRILRQNHSKTTLRLSWRISGIWQRTDPWTKHSVLSTSE